MEGRKHKKVQYIILSQDKINNLESYWREVEFKLNIIDIKTKKEIKTNLQNNINGIIGVLKKYTENKKINEEDKIQLYKELNEQLNKFNKCIEKINSETRGFKNIKEVVEGFKVKYYNVVGIKEKESNTAENGIGLFELFEVEKKVEETNEQSMKSSSGTGTETGSSTSSDSGEIKEVKEVKNKSGTTSTSSDSNENEMKEKQSDPAETPVFSEEDKKSKSGSCSSARSATSYSERELKEIEVQQQEGIQQNPAEMSVNIKEDGEGVRKTEVKETNEQSMKSSSGASTETGSSTSSDNCEMKEIKETKSKDDTTLTTSDSSENEMKEKQSDPAEMAVFSEEDKKSRSGSCSSVMCNSNISSNSSKIKEVEEIKSKSSTTSTSSDSNENEMKEKQPDPAETPVFSEKKHNGLQKILKLDDDSSSYSSNTVTNSSTSSKNDKTGKIKKSNTLKWSEIGNNTKKYISSYYNTVKTTRFTYKNAQQQVYQIAYHFAKNPVTVEENNSKTFAISDTHGDMGALLEALLRSRVVEFADVNNPCKVIVDPNNQENKILIPNLKIKDGCNNKLIILGDIIDRGQHSDSCMMLIRDILNKQKEQKSKNIILTVGNHEDMTITDTNDYQMTIDETNYRTGDNKDYNTARDVLTSMVEDDEMVFCYYDENSNTIYSHVPFDVCNTYNALKFVHNKIQKDDLFLGYNSIDNFKDLYKKIENQKKAINPQEKDNLIQKETKLLANILNKLYKHACKDTKVMEKLQDNVYCIDGQNNGLLWNRGYTSDKFKSIKGVNFVGGHDSKKEKYELTHQIQQNTNGTIIDIDTDRSCGYTDTTRTALVEIESIGDKKIKATKLDDVNTIKYNQSKTEIETINNNKPVELKDDIEFEVEDIDKYNNKSQTINKIVDDLKNSNFNTFTEYLKQCNDNKTALQDIVLNDEFKENCLFDNSGNGLEGLNYIFIQKFIFKIYQQYKKDHNNLDEMYSLYDEIFDVLNNESLKLTEMQKEVINTTKQETMNTIITLNDVFNTNGIEDYGYNKIKHILNNCCAYIERNDYNTETIKTIISKDEFKNNIRSSFGKKMVDINILRDNFIEPLIKKYNETHTNVVEQYSFVNTLFDTIDEQLNLTKDKKLSKNFKDIKAEHLQEIEQKFLISINDIQTNNDNSKVVKNIDKKLKMFVEDKKQVIGNTIELIKSQKSQLQNDNVKLQKAATLLILLEVYKVNIDKFIFFNEVYKKLNDTIKNTIEKKIKKQEIDLTQPNANLSFVIGEINNVLSKQGKESIKDINITF